MFFFSGPAFSISGGRGPLKELSVRAPEFACARCRLALIPIGAMLALLLAAPSHANLTIQIQSSTPSYDDPSAFELSVIVHNQGSVPLVVLPQGLRRAYSALGSGSAQYSPYPGPPIAPWKDAFALQPNEIRTLGFAGMRDGDGSWRLEPGRYELRVSLRVSKERAQSAEQHVAHLGAAVWQGTLLSPPIPVTYRPTPED